MIDIKFGLMQNHGLNASTYATNDAFVPNSNIYYVTMIGTAFPNICNPLYFILLGSVVRFVIYNLSIHCKKEKIKKNIFQPVFAI